MYAGAAGRRGGGLHQYGRRPSHARVSAKKHSNSSATTSNNSIAASASTSSFRTMIGSQTTSTIAEDSVASGTGGGGGGAGGRIFVISDKNFRSSSFDQGRTGGTATTASESLEMITASGTSSRSSRLPHLVPSSTDDLRMTSQLPGAILETNEDIESHGGLILGGGGPIVIKQELEAGILSRGGGQFGGEKFGDSSENVSRTSVFSDHLPCGLTRFHFSLCFGMVGFVVFWLGLLLRIYLPRGF